MKCKIGRREVDRLKAGGHPLADTLVRGFMARRLPSGRVQYSLRFQINGARHHLPLGLDGEITPEKARAAAEIARGQIRAGDNPAVERREQRRISETDTVAAVVADWLKRDQASNRSHAIVARMFDREVLPHWQDRIVSTITRRDCVELIDAIADRDAITAARRLHAHLHRMFRWAVGRGVIAANPMADLPKPGSEVRRDRVLTDAELVEVWRAAESIGWPFGAAVKLLVLTGARRDEIGALTWPEVDEADAVIRLEGARTKTGEPRAISLSATALAIVQDLRRDHYVEPAKGAPEYVFTTTGKTPISGWSRAKKLLDAKIVEARRKTVIEAGNNPKEAKPLPDWRVHDARRTAATGLQRLGFRLEVIEAVLGHVSGSRAGVVGVYQRHGFDREKREALTAWAAEVQRLIDPKAGGRVVAMRRKGRAAQ